MLHISHPPVTLKFHICIYRYKFIDVTCIQKFIFIIFWRQFTITDSLQGYHEKRLLNHLLNNYNLLERPVANESEPLEVKFGLTLQQIIDVVSILI